jgi:heme/copper-type cytochrome/quinol oxidase subunit 2
MPIAIEVVPQAQFAQWVAQNGGHQPNAKAPDATAASQVAPASVTAAGAPAPQPATPPAAEPAGNAAANAPANVANRATAND